jgi:hypothetical protein
MCKSPKIPTVNSSAAAFKKVLLKGDERSEVGIKATTAAGVLLSSRSKEERAIVILREEESFVFYAISISSQKRRRSFKRNPNVQHFMNLNFRIRWSHKCIGKFSFRIDSNCTDGRDTDART